MNFSGLRLYLRDRTSRGFTLIEVALAILILGSASVIIMSLLSTLTRTSYATLHDMLHMQRMQAVYYEAHRKRYPEREKNMNQEDDGLMLDYTVKKPDDTSTVGGLTSLLKENVRASWQEGEREKRLDMYYFWFAPKEEKQEDKTS